MILDAALRLMPALTVNAGDLLDSPVMVFVVLGTVLSVAGAVRTLLARDFVARLVGMNVCGVGSLLILLSLAARSPGIDAVLSALVITGLVITVAFTGLGAVLIRRIEGVQEEQERAGSRERPDRGEAG